MAELLPDYYSSLGPFRSAFQAGWIGLMYHKLGPRPAGTRLKGLYVSSQLFERQMAELAEMGCRSATPGELMSPAPTRSNQNRFLLSFDDGFANTLKHGVPAMSRHGFRAIQYLVADRLGGVNDWEVRDGEVSERLMDAAEIRDWMAAGHAIGAHSMTHPRLSQISTSAAKEEIAASRQKLEDLFGIEVRDFCYPYGDFNPTIRELVRDAGYHTACTTERGVNGPDSDSLALRRFMARYPSRHWRQWWKTLRLRWGGVNWIAG